MSKRMVIAYCAAYAVPPVLLEEVIECFVRQDYDGPKRLVIVNDTAGTRFHCKTPDVRVVNVPCHILPLGHKFDITVREAKRDAPVDAILTPWEQDDLWRPHAMRFGEAHVPQGGGHFHTSQHLAIRPTGWTLEGGVAHNNLFVSASHHPGYCLTDGIYADQTLLRMVGVTHTPIALADCYFISRWFCHECTHASLGQSPAATWDNLGDVELVPHWRQDYERIAREQIELISAGRTA